MFISSLARTSCQTGFWMNLNYNPCKMKFSSSSFRVFEFEFEFEFSLLWKACQSLKCTLAKGIEQCQLFLLYQYGVQRHWLLTRQHSNVTDKAIKLNRKQNEDSCWESWRTHSLRPCWFSHRCKPDRKWNSLVKVQVKCRFTSTETIRTIRDGEPRTPPWHSHCSCSVLLYVHRDHKHY